MSLVKFYSVWCDSFQTTDDQLPPEGCLDAFGLESSYRTVRALARRAGWKHVKGTNRWNSNDYCPPCAERRGIK